MTGVGQFKKDRVLQVFHHSMCSVQSVVTLATSNLLNSLQVHTRCLQTLQIYRNATIS